MDVSVGEPALDRQTRLIHNDDELKTTAILPWDRFSNWIHCACVVTFDLELGQAMEVSKQMQDRAVSFYS